ncbi:signal peptidase complex subunit SPC1 [Sporobolomyces salmoneus]|uniref:signal peptidase complex subunit SPC1 n=1 Tax=Sporobolomyces salmoneus TaxID=183962 RepID=UPI00317FD2AA
MQALDAQLDLLRTKLEGKIDFEGQELAEEWQKRILWFSGVLAFLLGLVLQSLKVTFGVFGLGFVLCLAVTAPSYSCYNSNPIEWVTKLNKFGLEGPEETTEGEKESSLTESEEGKKDR